MKKIDYKKIILLSTILLIVLTISNMVRPILYNSNSKGDVVEDEEIIVKCQYSLNRYFNIFKSGEYDALNNIISLLRNKSQKKYLAYASTLENKKDIVITQIMKVGSKVYSIKYYFDDEEIINTIIIKIKKDHFFVCYDSNIH